MSSPPVQRLKNILFLVNPAAGKAKKRHLLQFCKSVKAHGVKLDIICTKSAAHGERIAQNQAVLTYDAVAVAGGDGTIASIASGLYVLKRNGHQPPPLWIVPLGTANVLARELGLPLSAAKNAALILRQAVKKALFPAFLETAQEKKLFLQMASAGLDAQTVGHVSYNIKKYLGPLAYLLALMPLLFQKSPKVRVSVNGKTYTALCAIFSRGSLYGGPFAIAPCQHPTQKSSTLLLFQTERKWRLFKAVFGRLFGFPKLAPELLRLTLPAKAEVQFSGAGFIQRDGDLGGTLPATLKTANVALDFLTTA